MSWGKPKWVHLDVICIIHTVVFLSVQSVWNFLKLGGIWKRKKKRKKDIHRLSNFYNWLFICILYQWSFLYWKLKKKNLYWKKKLSGLSMWPRLDRVLSLASLVVSSNFFFVCLFLFLFFFVSKRCLILILLHVPHFVSRFQFRGGWDPLNRGKFHVSIRAVHIV